MASSQPSNKLQLAMTYGAYAGLAMIVITFIYSLRANFFMSANGLFCNIALIIGLSIGTRKYRDELLGGYARYGTILEFGTLIGLFAAVLYMLFNYVLFKYIDKNLMAEFFRAAEEGLLMQGRSEDEVETLMNLSRQVITPFMYAFFKFVQITFVGFLFSLVIAIFVKKDGDPFKQDMRGIE